MKLSIEQKKHLSEVAKQNKFGGYTSKRKMYFKKLNGEIVYMQSSYETKFASLLEFLGIEWSRPQPLKWIDKNGDWHWYYPDFLVGSVVFIDTKNDFLIKKDEDKIQRVRSQNSIDLRIASEKDINFEFILFLVCEFNLQYTVKDQSLYLPDSFYQVSKPKKIKGPRRISFRTEEHKRKLSQALLGSQLGSFIFITDGSQTKRVKKENVIPSGWKQGRAPGRIFSQETKKKISESMKFSHQTRKQEKDREQTNQQNRSHKLHGQNEVQGSCYW